MRSAFLLILGANAANVVLQWAQNTSDPGSTSVLSGSWLEYKIVQ